MHELGGPLLRRGEPDASSIAFQVEIPISHDLLAGVPPLQSPAVVGLKFQLSFAADVIEVLADRPGGLAPLGSTLTMTSGVRRTVRAISSTSAGDRRARLPGPDRA